MRRLVFALVLLSALTFSGCALNKMVKMAEEQELTVTPNPLEVHADTVAFDMSVLLPVKMLKKDKTYTVVPSYEYAGKTKELDGVEFTREQFPNADDQQPRIEESFAFAYEPDMKNGELKVKGIASDNRNGKSKETDPFTVAEGVITTSQLVKEPFFSAYNDHGYNNQEELIPVNVEFYFLQGSSYLRPSEKSSDRGDYFSAFIADKNVTRSVTITGTHSPEGPERVNENLAEDRAKVIEEWYRQNMRRYDYKGLADSINFILKPVVEDWTNFKEMLRDYDGISEQEKAEYMNIVNGPGSFEEKEDALHKLPTYDKVFDDIYPDLRTAKTEILTVKEKKTDAEISVLAKQITEGEAEADTLSEEEMNYAATLTPSIEEKKAIYEAAVKKSDSYIAHNNLGAVYLQMAEQATDEQQRNEYIEQAITEFELSLRKEKTAEAQLNLATAYMMQGRTGKAEEAVSMAGDMRMTMEENQRGANGVRGALLIRSAEYDQAVRVLSSAEETPVNMFNLALAQVLAQDYQNALTTLDRMFGMQDVEESVMADAHYLAAIANARLQRESAVFEQIGMATQMEPELREKALDDLEFRNYSDAEDFRNALK